MFAVVIASVEGAAVKDIAVAVIASTTLSSVAPATPVGIVKTSPTTASEVSKPETPIKLSVPDVSVLYVPINVLEAFKLTSAEN